MYKLESSRGLPGDVWECPERKWRERGGTCEEKSFSRTRFLIYVDRKVMNAIVKFDIHPYQELDKSWTRADQELAKSCQELDKSWPRAGQELAKSYQELDESCQELDESCQELDEG
jgi:hypothetical protein